jgi:hypothetical protein
MAKQKKQTEFKSLVLNSNPDLAFILSAHLYVENCLIELLEIKLPFPDKLFREYKPSFQQLLALCLAEGLITDDLALVLKKLNTIRNKFSHNLQYHLDKNVTQDFLITLNKMEKPFYIALVEPDEYEFGLAVSALCGHIQVLVDENKKGHEK